MVILPREARYPSRAIIAASRGIIKTPLELWDRDARIARRGGAVAQLGERRVRNAKVEGSIPFRSIFHPSMPVHPRPFPSMLALHKSLKISMLSANTVQ